MEIKIFWFAVHAINLEVASLSAKHFDSIEEDNLQFYVTP